MRYRSFPSTERVRQPRRFHAKHARKIMCMTHTSGLTVCKVRVVGTCAARAINTYAQSVGSKTGHRSWMTRQMLRCVTSDGLLESSPTTTRSRVARYRARSGPQPIGRGMEQARPAIGCSRWLIGREAGSVFGSQCYGGSRSLYHVRVSRTGRENRQGNDPADRCRAEPCSRDVPPRGKQ